MRWDDIFGQDRAVRLMRTALGRGQPHHAYLLAGPEGVGKELLARTFAQAANCEEPDEAERPCGKCLGCRGIERGNFPDVMFVMPQTELLARGLVGRADLEGAPSREIRVDEVRALAKRLSLAALRGRRKIAIVTPADAMNERAQNTLLKTLEEPPPATTFLLVSANPDALLPTIRSRCARVQLGPVSEEVLVARLVREGVPEPAARDRAAHAGGSFSRALAAEGEWRGVLVEVEDAIGAGAEMAQLIEEASSGKAGAVTLIEGDEYLARTSARELAHAIVPEKDRALNLIIVDAAAGAREIASHLVTVAMFAAPKAVVVEGADAFAEEVDAARELSRVRDLWQGKRQRDAARRLLRLVRPAGGGAG